MRLLALLLFIPLPLSAQTVWYVDAEATGAATGQNWTDAFPELQSALAVANPGDAVWVAEGVYRPTAATDRSATFVLRSGVHLFGGFAGTETTLNERDWAAHEALLSGDIGIPGQIIDNSYHVVTASGVAPTTLLDGFVIEGGNANGNAEPLGDAGGGLFMSGGSPTVQNVVVRANAAPNGAGIMARDGSAPLLVNVLFHDNLAGNGGGALAAVGSSNTRLVNITASANVATQGGGLYVSGSAVTLDNAILWSNQGGEIATVSGGTVTVRYAIVQGGSTGTAVLDQDPRFVAPAQGDYHLAADSPAREAGLDASLPADIFDLDGDGDTTEPIPHDLGATPRIGLLRVDLGAFEVPSPVCPPGPILYVDADANGAGTGLSWADAFASLAQALSHAAGCSYRGEVWVAEGDYFGAFALRSGLALYGGFDGTETSLDERDPAVHLTRLRATGPHTVTAEGTDATARLDGFQVFDGNALGASLPYGGGLLLLDSDAVIAQCYVSSNQAERGGGVYVDGGAPTFLENVITANTASGTDARGGGLYIRDGDVILSGGMITFNQADGTGISNSGYGGGLYIEQGSTTIRSTTFDSNRMPANVGYGAALFVRGGSVTLDEALFEGNDAFSTFAAYGGAVAVRGGAVVIRRASFVGNRALSAYFGQGGALDVSSGTITCVNCSFLENIAEASGDGGDGLGFGGAISVTRGTMTCANCLFADNLARADVLLFGPARARGGAVYVLDGDLTLVNTTATRNRAEEYSEGSAEGGGLYAERSRADLHNVIFWDNVGEDGPELFVASGAEVDVRRAIVKGGYPGTGVLDSAPLFVGPDDLRLQTGSPAIDFGLSSLLPPDTADLDEDGNITEPLPLDLDDTPRVEGASVDLGPYECCTLVATEPPDKTPSAFRLVGTYPNPFTATARLTFDLPKDARVTVEVFDLLGRRVHREESLETAAGPNRNVVLNARTLASGLYLVRLTAEIAGGDHYIATVPVTLVK